MMRMRRTIRRYVYMIKVRKHKAHRGQKKRRSYAKLGPNKNVFWRCSLLFVICCGGSLTAVTAILTVGAYVAREDAEMIDVRMPV